MLSILSDSQKVILDTITMGFHPVQALHYLKDAGHEMSERTYYRQKKKIQEMMFERMKYIAEHFREQHLERIDKCEIVERLMWENYYAEQDPTKRVAILKSILEMQTYLSVYYDSTRFILRQSMKSHADLEDPPTAYVSVPLRKWREEELKRDSNQGKLFDPYKGDKELEGWA